MTRIVASTLRRNTIALLALVGAVACGSAGSGASNASRCGDAQEAFTRACGSDAPTQDMADFFGNCAQHWDDVECGSRVRDLAACILQTDGADCEEEGPCATEWLAIEDGLCEDRLLSDPVDDGDGGSGGDATTGGGADDSCAGLGEKFYTSCSSDDECGPVLTCMRPCMSCDESCLLPCGGDLGGDAYCDVYGAGSCGSTFYEVCDAVPTVCPAAPPDDHGASCTGGGDCESGYCVDPEETGAYCTIPCFTDAECPESENCHEIELDPATATYGSVCLIPSD